VKTILAPVDFSAVSSSVVENAVTLARAVGGRLAILHVVAPPIIPGDGASVIVDLSAMQANQEKGAAAQLARLKAQFSSKDTEVETIEVGGMPTVQILEQAKKLGADYIVMGSHGHGAVYDLLIGGTTQAILKKAQCPVVVVPALGKTGGVAAKKRGRRPAGEAGGKQ
jgi:nucleotide-binding universal stress UspA family protein